ncbi:hypothetical protein [Lentisphaera araneosa]|nr:hypothetical protein [Lentisphaera araneosa]
MRDYMNALIILFCRFLSPLFNFILLFVLDNLSNATVQKDVVATQYLFFLLTGWYGLSNRQKLVQEIRAKQISSFPLIHMAVITLIISIILLIFRESNFIKSDLLSSSKLYYIILLNSIFYIVNTVAYAYYWSLNKLQISYLYESSFVFFLIISTLLNIDNFYGIINTFTIFYGSFTLILLCKLSYSIYVLKLKIKKDSLMSWVNGILISIISYAEFFVIDNLTGVEVIQLRYALLFTMIIITILSVNRQKKIATNNLNINPKEIYYSILGLIFLVLCSLKSNFLYDSLLFFFISLVVQVRLSNITYILYKSNKAVYAPFVSFITVSFLLMYIYNCDFISTRDVFWLKFYITTINVLLYAKVFYFVIRKKEKTV